MTRQTGSAEVLLINLGGPQTQDDIYPFLCDLFMDRDIIPIPIEGVVRRPFASFLASRRTRKVASRYAAIGGGSPLVEITNQEAGALQNLLERKHAPVLVHVAMRYGRPSLETAVEQLSQECRQLVALPLFPHFCRATTGTALKKLQAVLKAKRPDITLVPVDKFYDHPLYISSMAAKIREAAAELPPDDNSDPLYLFTAHSVPESYIKKGDPYVSQIQESVDLLVKELALSNDQWKLSYQSQVGPVSWVGPASTDVITERGQGGLRNLIVVPISFISDHLETLYDMDLELKKLAEKTGIKRFQRVECLNTDALFIEMLADLVESALSE